jgi:3'-phosphoadenosine 5'-phosphosulfate sulfotransferase (PAPS reductase)/FAD synthetase
MSLVELHNPNTMIDVLTINHFPNLETEQLTDVVELFHHGVLELRSILETTNSILHCPVSQGKDSTIVELMALEAYKQSIHAGRIEPNRPLILATVDTGGEAIPMKMYVAYAKKRILSYAKSLGINLIYDIVRPPLGDEYFVRFTGGKLVPNATRHGDCSIILKVDPSESYLKTKIKEYASAWGRNFHVVTCVGSRNAESQRRARNMTKQGIALTSGEQLLNTMQVEQVGKMKIFKFAPIKDWTTEQVFDALRIAGSRPLMKFTHPDGLTIPGFLSDFGLLMAIYGNGTNETCEISVGSKASSGCNGKARFGCVYCTMVAVTDHSSTALASMERWRVLGAENALRVRDYLFRLSSDIDARALHARAFDPVAFNRVALQPNTLKPRFLEKMVRYACQLTVDSIRIANEFKALVERGCEMEHPGYRDIANDMTIPPKTKKAFLEMYKESAQDANNLNMLFSFEHSLLLSFRWSIDGIAAAPYRPLSIWLQVEKGEGRIPYPPLNRELIERGGVVSLQSNKPLPEAVMMPILKTEDPVQHALAPIPLLSLWTRPTDFADIYEEDHNCTIVRSANHTVDISIHYEQHYAITPIQANDFEPFHCVVVGQGEQRAFYRIKPTTFTVERALVDGRTISPRALSIVTEAGVYRDIENSFYEKLENLCQYINRLDTSSIVDVRHQLSKAFPTQCILKRELKHFKKVDLFTGYQAVGRKINLNPKFTRRVIKKVHGAFVKGNTRLSFYPLVLDSAAHIARKEEITMLTPDFTTHTHQFVGTHDANNFMTGDNDGIENLFVDPKALEEWRLVEGVEKALLMHDQFIHRHIHMRHHKHAYKTSTIRHYGGTHVAEQLLANGVISCEKRYWSQLQSILKRTHIFNELGLFTFQSMSIDDVARHPKAISMAQHRHDKAKVLQVIRSHRNAQRQAMKSITTLNTSYSHAALDTLESITLQAVSGMTTALNSSLFKLRFDTHDVDPSQQAKVFDVWLALHYDDLTHLDKVMTKLMTASQFKTLKEHPVDYVQMAHTTLAMLSRVKTTVESTMKEWEPLLHHIHHIIQSGAAGGEVSLTQIKTIIQTFSPIHDDGTRLLEYWMPNISYAMRYLNSILKLVQGYQDTLKKLCDDIGALQRAQLNPITAKMSLSDKLAIFKKRAA